MKVAVDEVGKSEILSLISSAKGASLTEVEQASFAACLALSTNLFVGTVDRKFICCWGLIPPTLLADDAYLWLYTSELTDLEFLFVRHSQMAVKAMLEVYPIIRGQTVGGDKTKRWLRWLGAKFGETQGGLIPFEIRKQ